VDVSADSVRLQPASDRGFSSRDNGAAGPIPEGTCHEFNTANA